MTRKVRWVMSGMGLLLGATVMCARAPQEWTPKQEDHAATRPADNSRCLTCHGDFKNETITRVHARQNTFCVDCHGASLGHLSDQALTPDFTFSRDEVAPLCARCHNPGEHPDTSEFLDKWRGRERPNGRVITAASICTDCHGSHVTAAGSAAAPNRQPAAAWIPLFNGKDLTGWAAIGAATWTVQDGTLVGEQGEKNAPGDLLTTAEYRDFELVCTYRAVWPANTGIWFRYQSAKQAYQADILEWPKPIAYSGTLYCPGKMFLAINSDRNLERREGWNTMRVRAEGDHLEVWLNGRQTADVRDAGSATGKIGFQVHPGEQFGPMKLIVRDIRLRLLGEKGKE